MANIESLSELSKDDIFSNIKPWKKKFKKIKKDIKVLKEYNKKLRFIIETYNKAYKKLNKLFVKYVDTGKTFNSERIRIQTDERIDIYEYVHDGVIIRYIEEATYDDYYVDKFVSVNNNILLDKKDL